MSTKTGLAPRRATVPAVAKLPGTGWMVDERLLLVEDDASIRAATNQPVQLGVCKVPVAAGNGSGGRRFDIAPGDPDASTDTEAGQRSSAAFGR